MLKIINTVKNYNIGNSKIELEFADLFTDIKNGLVLNTKPTFCSVSNVGIVKDVELFTDKITFMPTKQIKTSNKVYNCIIKISANVPKLNATGQFDSTLGTVDKYYYIKIKLCPKIDGSNSELYVEAYEKLSPDQYQADKQHEKDNLDALVSKKALINNLKEFGNQVKNKIANTHKYEIKYDLAGGYWPDNSEGRHTFCNAEAYSPPDLERPERNGYIFKGWQLYKLNDETGTPLIPESEIAVDNMIQVGTDYDVEAEALWTPETITINIRDENGDIKGTVNKEYEESSVLKDLIKDITAPVKDCYILNGWEIKNSTYEKKVVFKDGIELYDLFSLNDFSTTIDLYPVYRPITAEIIFNFGGDNSIYLPDYKSKGNKYTYGQAFVLPVPIKLNYKFKGWTIKQKGKSGEPLLSNADTKDKLHFIIDAFELEGYDKDTELELTPSFVEEYISINYHLSDSSLIPYMSGIIQTSEYKTKFTRKELTSPNKVLLIKPSSTGFKFTGWQLGDDYKNIFKIDEENNKYYLSVLDLNKFNKTELGATIDLYAIWKAEKVDVTIEVWEESVNSTGKYIAKDNSGVVESDTCAYELFSVFKTNDFSALEENVTLSKVKEKIPLSFTTTGFKCKKFTENDDNELVHIKPDGSTVIKFYYYRKEYTVKVTDIIKGGYLTESSNIELKRLFKKNNPSEWKSILASSNSVDPDFADSFTVKYGQTIKQEAEFIKDLNLDKNTYGELSLECYSLPTKIIQSEQVGHSNITFEFEYTRKKFPITLNLNGYGYFGDISNPTYSITSTVQANIKADSVLGKDNFKYKTYWIYNDNIFHISNKDEIITGPKVYNLEKIPNVDESQIWRKFNATATLEEKNGVDKVLGSNGLPGPDITETNLIDGLKLYESASNIKYTSFDRLKMISLPNTKLGNYWLTGLNIHVNNSPGQSIRLKDLDIEYFEKRIPSSLTTTNDVQVTFVPFVERLEPDISGIITLSNITSDDFIVNGIVVKDGASHVLVSLDNLNYENIIKISSSCIRIQENTTTINVPRNSKVIEDGTIIYFIAIKKIKKNDSDFFVVGKMYGAKVIVDGTTANLINWQEVVLPNIALKQNPYIISIKKNESAVNCIEFTDIEFSEEIKDLIFTIKNNKTDYEDTDGNKDHYKVIIKKDDVKVYDKNNFGSPEPHSCRIAINNKKISKLNLYIIPTYKRNYIQKNIVGINKKNTFNLSFSIGVSCSTVANDLTEFKLLERTNYSINYKLVRNSKYLACCNQYKSHKWGSLTYNTNINIKQVVEKNGKLALIDNSIIDTNENKQLFYQDDIYYYSNNLYYVNSYATLLVEFNNSFKFENNTIFNKLQDKYIKFVGIYGIKENGGTNYCYISSNRYYNDNSFWYSIKNSNNEYTGFDKLEYNQFKSFLENSSQEIETYKGKLSIDGLYFDLTSSQSTYDPLIFKVSSSSSSSSSSDKLNNFKLDIKTINISNNIFPYGINLVNKDFTKINITNNKTVLNKSYPNKANDEYNSYTKLGSLATANITINNNSILLYNSINEIKVSNNLILAEVNIKSLPVYSYEGVDIIS